MLIRITIIIRSYVIADGNCLLSEQSSITLWLPFAEPLRLFLIIFINTWWESSCKKLWYCRQTEFSNVHRIYESICNQAIKGMKDYHIKILKTSLAYDAHSNDWGNDKPFFEVGFHIILLSRILSYLARSTVILSMYFFNMRRFAQFDTICAI